MLLTTTKEIIDNVLQPLSAIIEEIRPQQIAYWVLQYVDASSSSFFHYSSWQDFEFATRDSLGLMVNNEEFKNFITEVIDFREGTIIALTHKESMYPKFILQNFDSSEWILETNDQDIIERLISLGWKESLYPPEQNYYKTVCE
jgi:hypothetical protein